MAEAQIAPDDTIASALAAAYAEHEQAAPAEPVAEKPAPEAAEAEPAPPKEGERARGPDGKFVKTEEPELPLTEVTEPAAEAKPTEAEKPEGEAAETKPDTREAPANWKAADKETFKALPAEAQDFLLRRHKEMEAGLTKKTQEIATFRKD